MEVLEVKNIKDKKITVYLIEDGNPLWTKYEEMGLSNLLETNNFKFVTIDSDFEENNGVSHNRLQNLLKKYLKTYYFLDIPEYAKSYLFEEIENQIDQIEELEIEYRLTANNEDEKDAVKKLNLKSWIDYLKNEVQEKENTLDLEIRPHWIIKGLVDLINLHEDKNLHIIHLTTKELLPKIKKALEEFDITVIPYNIKTRILVPQQIIKQVA